MNVEEFKKRAIRALVRDKYFYLPVESASVNPTVRFVACWRAVPYYTGSIFVLRRNDGISGGRENVYGKSLSRLKEIFVPKNVLTYRIYVNGTYEGAITASFGMTFAQSIIKTFTNPDPDDAEYVSSLDSSTYVYPSVSTAAIDAHVDMTGSVSYDRNISQSVVYGIDDRVQISYTYLPHMATNYHVVNTSFSLSEIQTLTSSVISRTTFNRNTGVLQSFGQNDYHYEYEGDRAITDTSTGYTGWRIGAKETNSFNYYTGISGQAIRPSLFSSAKLWTENFMNDAELITQQQFIDGQYTIARDQCDNSNPGASDGIIKRNSVTYYYLFDGLTAERYLEVIRYAQDSGTTVICEYEN